jgi:radical SAM superfamily enzyme YgiQ (UPF0313 family)
MTQKILLVSPGAEASHKPQASWRVHSNEFFRKQAFTSPLHIATIAALTPDDYEVDLWDEPVQGMIDEATAFAKEYDLVGITGYGLHFERACEIARVFRARGVPVAIGGPGISSVPEMYREHFDILFIGEAEETWPQFIKDFRAGDYRDEYRATTLPDLSLSPPPRWDSIAAQMKSGYLTASVQVTRGCPYNCEFCDVWQLFGRKMRVKPIERVLEEIAAVQRFGVESVLLCSDNFHGNPRYAKELISALIPLNNSFAVPIQYRTELTITVARDEELLELMADANFSGFLVGIESPSEASLNETRKRQNIRFGDLTENCKKVLSYGVPIEGSMIVGFDSDTPDIFDLQYEFLQEACIPFPRPHILKAIRGTDLWKRLTKEGRVIEVDKLYGNTMGIDAQNSTNIIPKQMTRVELLTGYLKLIERIFEWDSFEKRIKGFVSNVRRQPNVREKDLSLVALLRAGMPKLDARAAHSIENVLSFAEQHAPFMLQTVAILAVRQYQEVLSLPHTRESLLAQIALEETLDATQLVSV